MKKNCNTEEEKRLIQIIEEYLPQYRAIREEIVYGKTNTGEESLELLNVKAKPVMNKATDAATQLMNLNVEMGNKIQKRLTYQTYIILAVMLIIMAASVIKQRTIEKFIMSEFVQGNLNTKEQVSCMLILIQKKLGMSVEQASDFMRNAIGINT